MTDDQRWSANDVAAYLDVKPSTVRAYATRGQMPAPDGRIGRTSWWFADTIRAWRPPLANARDGAPSS